MCFSLASETLQTRRQIRHVSTKYIFWLGACLLSDPFLKLQFTLGIFPLYYPSLEIEDQLFWPLRKMAETKAMEL